MSDPELLREWIESVNGRATNNPSVGEPQPAAPLTAQHRLEAPSYYAANAQVLVHGESAMLLFTRTQPVMLSNNGNIAPMPLRDPVAIIQMNVHGLADLSKATADVIWQIEQQSRQTEVNSTRLVNSIPRAVLCNAPNGDVLPADRCEQVASGATTPPKRRARLREWLTGLKGLFRRS